MSKIAFIHSLGNWPSEVSVICFISRKIETSGALAQIRLNYIYVYMGKYSEIGQYVEGKLTNALYRPGHKI